MAPKTTSATRRGMKRRRWTDAAGPEGGSFASASAGGRRGGFTLIEVLLVSGLVVLLLSLGVASFRGMYQGEQFGEGARQVESILRMARADACARWRRVRLVFDGDTLQGRIEWEPSPLAEPGVFQPHTDASWANQLPAVRVRFSRCERVGASAHQMLTYQSEAQLESEEGKLVEPITFYPGGSCDSAIIELAGLDDLEMRIGRIDLDGVNGTIVLRILTPTEQDEQEEIDAEAIGL